MSFQEKMATAEELANQYVEKPFEYSVKTLVRDNIYVLGR